MISEIKVSETQPSTIEHHVPVECPHCHKKFFQKIKQGLITVGEAVLEVGLSNLGAFQK